MVKLFQQFQRLKWQGREHQDKSETVTEKQVGLWFGDRKDEYNNYAEYVVYEQYNLYIANIDEIRDELAAEMQNMDSQIDEYNQNIANERARINRAMLTLQ